MSLGHITWGSYDSQKVLEWLVIWQSHKDQTHQEIQAQVLKYEYLENFFSRKVYN